MSNSGFLPAFGEYYIDTKGNEVSSAYRIIFLNKTKEIVPEIWKKLYEDVYKDNKYSIGKIISDKITWRELKEKSKNANNNYSNLYKSLKNWADEEVNITENWFLKKAMIILKKWNKFISENNKSKISFSELIKEVKFVLPLPHKKSNSGIQIPIVVNSDIDKAISPDKTKIKFNTYTFEPLIFKRDEFEKKVKEELEKSLNEQLDEIIELCEKNEYYKKVKEIKKLEHFDWLILSKIKGMSQTAILDYIYEQNPYKDLPQSQGAISQAITDKAEKIFVNP